VDEAVRSGTIHGACSLPQDSSVYLQFAHVECDKQLRPRDFVLVRGNSTAPEAFSPAAFGVVKLLSGAASSAAVYLMFSAAAAAAGLGSAGMVVVQALDAGGPSLR
jgi:hypothetical protein